MHHREYLWGRVHSPPAFMLQFHGCEEGTPHCASSAINSRELPIFSPCFERLSNRVSALQKLFLPTSSTFMTRTSVPSGFRYRRKMLQLLVFFLGDSGRINNLWAGCVIFILCLNCGKGSVAAHFACWGRIHQGHLSLSRVY